MVVRVRVTADSKGVTKVTRGGVGLRPIVPLTRTEAPSPRPRRRTPVSHPSRGWRCSEEARSRVCSVVRTYSRGFAGQPQAFKIACPQTTWLPNHAQTSVLSLLRRSQKTTTRSVSRDQDGSGDCSSKAASSSQPSRYSNSFGIFGSCLRVTVMPVTTSRMLNDCASF